MRPFRIDDNVKESSSPLQGHPAGLQVAALCRREREGRIEILLLSSLRTRRWILPKGWPMVGRSLADSALREAWEEAGVRGLVSNEAIGRYGYDKIRAGGQTLHCDVQVFPVDEVTLADQFPEAGRRRRKWVRARRAAELVAEPELRDLLAAL